MIFEKSDHMMIPAFAETHSFRARDIIRFNGFKEDIYVADFDAPSCGNDIPFKDYVLLRPEAYKAYYLDSPEKSIVPEIMKLLLREGMNIVLLPRYPEEREKYGSMGGVFIPDRPVNGLCASFRARAVLTGSGTMGREAASMAVPSVSFFPGKKLLSVDREMINTGLLFHSRDPKEITNFVLSSRKSGKADLSRSRRVKKEVISSIALNAKESFFKFSIDKDSINAALDEEIQDITSSAPFLDVYCMPIGGNKKSIKNNTYVLIEYCKAKGYNFSDRLHIRIWDDNKGV
jgi:predicted glycosyltransferase